MGNITQRLARIRRLEVALFTTMQEYSSIDRESLIAHFLDLWNDTTRRTICEYLGVVMKKNGWIAEEGLIIQNKYKAKDKAQTTLDSLEKATNEAPISETRARGEYVKNHGN